MRIERHYGLDWLRFGAFTLLILYHIGMVFVPWDFHIKTSHPIDWIKFPTLAPNPWRLVLLFVISGYATCALHSRLPDARSMMWSRSTLLLVPLLFGIAVIVPPQSWVQLKASHGYTRSFFVFWTHDYFRFGAFDTIILPTWNHLWFVAYLWVYTMFLVSAGALFGRTARARLQALFDKIMTASALLFGPIMWLVLVRIILFPMFGETHALADDWAAHAMYFPAFLIGFAMAGDVGFWHKIATLGRTAVLTALLGGIVFLSIEVIWNGFDRTNTIRLKF